MIDLANISGEFIRFDDNGDLIFRDATTFDELTIPAEQVDEKKKRWLVGKH